MTAEEQPDKSAGGLFRSLSGLLTTLVAFVQTRLELLSVEIEEEIHRAAGVLIWASLALFLGGIGLLMAGFTVIIAFWDSHRLLAAVLVTLAFFILAGLAVLALRNHLRVKPRLLDATRAELEKDRIHPESKL